MDRFGVTEIPNIYSTAFLGTIELYIRLCVTFGCPVRVGVLNSEPLCVGTKQGSRSLRHAGDDEDADPLVLYGRHCIRAMYCRSGLF
jgi:hypothetical protein